MAGVNWDRTKDHVERPESSVGQFCQQSEIRETKGNEAENIYKKLSRPPDKINNNNNLDVLGKGESHSDRFS